MTSAQLELGRNQGLVWIKACFASSVNPNPWLGRFNFPRAISLAYIMFRMIEHT